MSQRILNHLDVHARFAHPGREGMPQGVAAETWQKYGTVRILRQHFIVAVPDDAPDGLVQRSLMLALTKAVDKDEVRVTVHRYRAADLCFFLIGTFLFKGFFHEVHHRNGADASLRFRRVAVEVAALLTTVVLTVVVIDQRVIDGDRAFLKIHITPAQTSGFSYAQTRSQHDCENWIPMLVLRRFGEVGQQQILLCYGQCLTAVGFKLVCLFQLPQNVV